MTKGLYSTESLAVLLSNSNLLLCDGPSGTFFEVNSQGDKVWEYINPDAITGIISQSEAPNANPVLNASFTLLVIQDLQCNH